MLNGEQRKRSAEVPDDCAVGYEALRRLGCRLTAEVLMTGLVSQCVEHEEGPGIGDATSANWRFQMKLTWLCLLAGMAAGAVGCHSRTNWDYIQSHHCVFDTRQEQGYVIANGERELNPLEHPSTSYYCEPDHQWVEVYDSELPRGVSPQLSAVPGLAKGGKP